MLSKEQRKKHKFWQFFYKTIIWQSMKDFEGLLSKEKESNKEAFKNIQKAARSAESSKEQQTINRECSEK